MKTDKYIGRKGGDIVVIRYSCLTGKAVWVYRGPSKGASYTAYCRACRQEVERVRSWSRTAGRRRENIMRMLGECTAAIPVTEDMTPQQKEAAGRLLAAAREKMPCSRDFYDHVVEERRRRQEDAEIRRQMREREQNRCYDK